ncbi:MAG: hypothetical protein J0L55_06585 [Caulobacterales bacterium]|nr:hypothetical protein [Caulobacterales bacterium]MCA0372910.1 hypothetical protein [Pseudomonadota bacterium]
MIANNIKYISIIFFLVFSCDISNAGAWLPSKHENQIIISAIQNNDNNQNIEIYFEHGINNHFAFVYEQGIAIENGANEIGEALIATRYKLYEKDNWVGAAQFGIVANEFSTLKDTKINYEIRALVGKGFSNGWANVEIGSRQCLGSNSLRWESTIGFNAFKSDKFILKAFGENDGCAKGISRAQISYVKSIDLKPIDKEIAIEFGYREGIGNDKLYAPGRIIIGLWARF